MSSPVDFPQPTRSTPSGPVVTTPAYAAGPAETESKTSRMPSMVLGFLLGALVGAIGTVAHPNTLSIAGAEIPYGLLLGLLASLALMMGMRLLYPGRGAVIATGIGLVGMIALFTLPGPGGAVLIDQSLYSLVWTLGPVLIATIVIAWPRFTAPVRRIPEQPGVPGNSEHRA
ncbi:hypothetical protein M2390_000670 [Mycetocola sp. BIGb0189]|uniref:DUF6113 family protein n=1 Tax=Mycetocola sp. BIGb0189 TaxID=2940604 RepID=UPI002169163D|nr:DUF6113 family protein [Mycetocola sp. BIGb0189]MCS4275509.1 hypothetical protein [Mycetocola sp. BIGb0189]